MNVCSDCSGTVMMLSERDTHWRSILRSNGILGKWRSDCWRRNASGLLCETHNMCYWNYTWSSSQTSCYMYVCMDRQKGRQTDFHLFAASLNAPTGCHLRSLARGPRSVLYPARREWPRPCWTYESRHSSDWTHSPSMLTILSREHLSTPGGLQKRNERVNIWTVHDMRCCICCDQ